VTGTVSVNVRSISLAASPMATTAQPRRERAQHRKVETLVATAGDQHDLPVDLVERGDRGECRGGFVAFESL
jgi:hypothetical protein